MKLKYEFVTRNILDEYILVPVGEAALQFAGMITTSEVGAFLVEALRNDVTLSELTALLVEQYDVDEATARTDVEEFIGQMRKLDLLD